MKTAAEIADDFNRAHPVGSTVTYARGWIYGPAAQGEIQAPPA